MAGVAAAMRTIASTPAAATPSWPARGSLPHSHAGMAATSGSGSKARQAQQALQLTPLRGVSVAGPSECLQATLVVLRGLLVRGAPDRLSPGSDRVVGGLAGVAVVGRLGKVVREFLYPRLPGPRGLRPPGRAAARAGPPQGPRTASAARGRA